MGISPFSDGGDETELVDQMIGTSYKNVRHVAENIEYVKHVSGHMPEVYRVAQSIENIDNISVAAEAILDIQENLPEILDVPNQLVLIEAAKDSVDASVILVEADKDQVSTDAGIVAADKAIVAADKVIVAADKALALGYKNDAEAAAVAAAEDAVETAENTALTAADRIQTGLDVIETALDVIATAADRAAVSADKDTVAADRDTVADDKAIVAADKDLVAADKVTVAADLVSTAAERALAELAETNAAAHAAAALVSETNAAASDASAAAAVAPLTTAIALKADASALVATDAAVALKADLASPTFTGTVQLPATTNVGTTIRSTSTTLTMSMGTTDGSDTGFVLIRGGDGTNPNRGAYVVAYGNDHATNPGKLLLVNGLNGDMVFTAGARNITATGAAFTFNGVNIATQAYVDAATSTAGLQLVPCDLATIAAPGTLTGTLTIDGVTSGNGKRILVKNHATPNQNGIWLTNSGGAWTRATDSDSWAELTNKRVMILGGSLAGTSWASTITSGGTLNTTDVTYAQSGANSVYTGSGGVSIVGTIVSLDGSVLTTLGLNNVDNTSDADKPVSTAQQTALDLKANIAALGTISALSTITTSYITDAAVTNAKLATIATSTLKGRLTASTGAVEDLTLSAVKTAMSLGSVNNTSDVNKPVSTAQAAAIALKADATTVATLTTTVGTKAPIASPAFTGTPTAPTPAFDDVSTKIANMLAVRAAVAKRAGSDLLHGFGASGLGGSTDLDAVDARETLQAIQWPRLQKYAYGSIQMGQEVPGSDTENPMEYLRKYFASIVADANKAYVFGAERAWDFGVNSARPGTYITLPRNCVLEWRREFDFTKWTHGFSPRIFSYIGTWGEVVTPVTTALVKDVTKVITLPSGKGALYKPGMRLALYTTAQLTTLVGAFTLMDNQTTIYGARSEMITVKQVIGDVLYLQGPVKDNYASGTAFRIAAYLDEGVHKLINPMIDMGAPAMIWAGTWFPGLSYSVNFGIVRGTNKYICLSSHTSGALGGSTDAEKFAADLAAGKWLILGNDTMFHFERTARVTVVGGECNNIAGRFLSFSSVGRFDVRDHKGNLNNKGEGSPGGYFNIGGNCEYGLFQNVHTNGGSQPFMNSTTGGDYGVTRYTRFIDCSANDCNNGFSQHNMEEHTEYINCTVRNSTGAAFDSRNYGTRIINCKTINCESVAYLRSNVGGAVIEGGEFTNSGPIRLTTFVATETPTGEHEVVPGNITIKNNIFNGVTEDFNAISLEYGDVSSAVLGSLNLDGNDITMAAGNTGTAIEISGKWQRPTVTRNKIRHLGVTGIAIRLDGGSIGAGNGSFNPAVTDNFYASSVGPTILHSTGTVTNTGNVPQ